MASFMSDENDLSFIHNITACVLSPRNADDSSDDFAIKQPVFDLSADTPEKAHVAVHETAASSSSPSGTTAQAGPGEEDIRRMDEESERLAWELMQQDNLEAYNYQVEFMRENSAALDPADLAALQQAMEEERRNFAAVQPEGEEDDEVDNSEEWTYDRLLALGEAVGGNYSISTVCLYVVRSCIIQTSRQSGGS